MIQFPEATPSGIEMDIKVAVYKLNGSLIAEAFRHSMDDDEIISAVLSTKEDDLKEGDIKVLNTEIFLEDTDIENIIEFWDENNNK